MKCDVLFDIRLCSNGLENDQWEPAPKLSSKSKKSELREAIFVSLASLAFANKTLRPLSRFRKMSTSLYSASRILASEIVREERDSFHAILFTGRERERDFNAFYRPRSDKFRNCVASRAKSSENF